MPTLPENSIPQRLLPAAANQNNISRTHDGMTVAEIRTKARETVLKETRGASALSLIRTARTQLQLAKDLENKGDLKGALNAYIKAASLAKLTMDSTEFTTPAERKGALRKELQDFLEVCCFYRLRATHNQLLLY